uniref:Thiopurine S-methyltransferase n=1 Tax=Phasianus colchicus TaxID=9054 RepID=A0A669P103_PHACC
PSGTAASRGSEAQRERVLSVEEWLRKWSAGATGFHKEHRHPLLQKHLDLLVDGRNGLRIFFPLCGKAVDMKWLADMGHSVVGVDVSEQALKEFFADQCLPYCEEPVPGISGAKKLQVCLLHFVGKFDGVWDRGALVAVNPCDRQRSVNLLGCCFSLMHPVTLFFTIFFPGPPFYVPESEVKSLFGKYQCEIKCLQKVNDFSDKHKQWGLDYFLEVMYLIKFVA